MLSASHCLENFVFMKLQEIACTKHAMFFEVQHFVTRNNKRTAVFWHFAPCKKSTQLSCGLHYHSPRCFSWRVVTWHLIVGSSWSLLNRSIATLHSRSVLSSITIVRTHYMVLLDSSFVNCRFKLLSAIWFHHVNFIFAADFKNFAFCLHKIFFLTTLSFGISVL